MAMFVLIPQNTVIAIIIHPFRLKDWIITCMKILKKKHKKKHIRWKMRKKENVFQNLWNYV